MTPEGKVKKAVDQVLHEHKTISGTYALKPVQNGMGSPALDYHGSHKGFAFVIETKAPGKSPTPRQLSTLRRIALSGASCFLIDGDTTELSNWLVFPLAGYVSQRLQNDLNNHEEDE